MRSRRRKIVLATLGSLLFVALGLLAQAWKPIGKAPAGERLDQMQASPQWGEGIFENPQALWNDPWGMTFGALDASPYGSPSDSVATQTIKPQFFETPPSSGLRVTWLGHSTTLIEIGDQRILTDPVWGPRTSPFSWLGPERWYEPLIELEQLPKIDAVLISHDHYDHLDYPTIVEIKDWDTTFIAPLGVGAHLEYWGVPSEKIIELDWWDDLSLGSLKLVSVPSRHASGRQVFDQNRTLWSGYAMINAKHRVLFSGDTGLFPGMKEIGDRLGPFDLTMIEIGAYGQAWPDWHLGPEQAIEAHKLMRGKALLPIHWGLFNLAFHGWTEPIERARVAAQEAGVQLLTPKPGQSYDPEQSTSFDSWWPEQPWNTAEQYPIQATKVESIYAQQ